MGRTEDVGEIGTIVVDGREVTIILHNDVVLTDAYGNTYLASTLGWKFQVGGKKYGQYCTISDPKIEPDEASKLMADMLVSKVRLTVNQIADSRSLRPDALRMWAR